MYRVLKGEMVKTGITISQLADKIGVAEKTMRNKINGDTEFTWPEVCMVHRIVNPLMSKDELFRKDTEK